VEAARVRVVDLKSQRARLRSGSIRNDAECQEKRSDQAGKGASREAHDGLAVSWDDETV
jgi:hypothetical protein